MNSAVSVAERTSHSGSSDEINILAENARKMLSDGNIPEAQAAAEKIIGIIKSQPDGANGKYDAALAKALRISWSCIVGPSRDKCEARQEIIQKEIDVLRRLPQEHQRFELAKALSHSGSNLIRTGELPAARRATSEATAIFKDLSQKDINRFGTFWMRSLIQEVKSSQRSRWHERIQIMEAAVADARYLVYAAPLSLKMIRDAETIFKIVQEEVCGTTMPISMKVIRHELARLRKKRVLLFWRELPFRVRLWIWPRRNQNPSHG